MAKTGRKPKPYISSDGTVYPGLCRQPDGRWRIIETGFRWTQPDERLAVKRFLEWKSDNTPAAATAWIPATAPIGHGSAAYQAALLDAATADVVSGPDGQIYAGVHIPEAHFYARVRHELLTMPDVMAAKTGVPELAHFGRMSLPKPAISLNEIIKVYETQNPSTAKAKARCISIFRQLVDHASAKTVDDLTQPRLLAFRETVEKSTSITSAGTRVWMYGQIKAMLAFALKCGLDQVQIRSCLDRCSVLWTAAPLPNVQPKPISREDFHKLLNIAGKTHWRAWLLMGLNTAQYLEELCEMTWADINLDAGTFAKIRTKTRRERVPRAAILWPETIAALKALPRKPIYVFTAPTGTRYGSSTSRANKFAILREKAGVSSDVGFASLKDAAYTTAAQSAPDERLARVLAGHRAGGMQDNYVLRHPELVRPACDAVYRVFGPFPEPD